MIGRTARSSTALYPPLLGYQALRRVSESCLTVCPTLSRKNQIRLPDPFFKSGHFKNQFDPTPHAIGHECHQADSQSSGGTSAFPIYNPATDYLFN